jgi:hypothetical protein
MLPGQQIGECAVDLRLALLGEHHPNAAPIMWVSLPAYQPSCFKPVNPVGHRAARHHRLTAELAGGEGVGIPGAAQGCQNVKLPRFNADGMEGASPGEIQMTSQAGDPAEYLEGADIKVWALTLPSGYEVVNFIAHPAIVRQES